MSKEVKSKIVVSHPDEVITTLTDLIQKGEVNVVLFNDYQERISPDVLEKKLSQSFNLTTGWETEEFSWSHKKEGLIFNRIGEVKVKDQDVKKYIEENGFIDQFYFPNGEDSVICEGVSDYVKNTLPGLIKKGETLDDILDFTDGLWDHVGWVMKDYLGEDVQELNKSYCNEKYNDFTLWYYTYGVLKECIKREYESIKSEC